MEPGEIREYINEAVGEASQFPVSDTFESLMNYLDLDILVAWFVDEVCEGDPEANLFETDKAKEIQEYYNAHC